MSEFIHVAQFFESSLAFTIPALITAQILHLKYAMWESIDAISEHEYEENERWREN